MTTEQIEAAKKHAANVLNVGADYLTFDEEHLAKYVLDLAAEVERLRAVVSVSPSRFRSVAKKVH